MISEIIGKFRQAFAPPPKLTISEWADAHRVLSAESSAEPGKWYTDRAPYQRGIMDALSNPAYQDVVWMASAQIGKTELVNNVVGYFIDQDPAPMLVVQPTLDMAKTWSKDRLAPMLRDTPRLRGKVKDARSRDANNTTLHKTFPGGHVSIVGANSAAGLASRPIRIVLCDEVDRYPVSAGTEGDPVKLAFKRSNTFWNKRRFLISTPTVKGASRIEMAFAESDQRRFFVPCPQCGEFQTLKWANVAYPAGNPGAAVYACDGCGAEIIDRDKPAMLRRGEWRATAPFTGVVGFHINELYSPWRTFADVAGDHETAKKDRELFKVWTNTALGEPFDEDWQETDNTKLAERAEEYGPDIPAGCGLLTIGVDVQDDRLEYEIVGHGKRGETWGIEIGEIDGKPDRRETWDQLDELLTTPWIHENGHLMQIGAACIDSGGHFTQEVYQFVKGKTRRLIYAIKGRSERGRPVLSKESRNNAAKIPLIILGVDTIKDTLYSRLSNAVPGPGYCHFPKTYNAEYFKQLTSEEKVRQSRGGVIYNVWRQKGRGRQEALDCRVYAMAALQVWLGKK